MQAKLLITTIAAFAVLGVTAADAGHRKYQRHGYHHHGPIVVHGSPYRGYGYFRYPDHPPNRPAWTRGTECYTDEGYGRFSPCDMSRSGR